MLEATPERPPDATNRVLVVEDEESIRDLLVQVLHEEGYDVEAVADGQEALTHLDSRLYDLVLLDLNLPRVSGLNVLSAAPALQTDARFVAMTAYESVDTAVEAMKLGAFDYLRKPFRTDELLLVLERAREELALRREVAHLRRTTSVGGLGAIVGKTPAMRRMFDMIERVAPTRASVLILGETGTGKELVARAIHDLSDRGRRPFVALNCSALPETLLESELFGHVKGSFTGAIENRRGLFEEAQGGTLFLDEISTIPASTQVKLLRVLQERKIQRVGGREPISVDFRLVVATNVELGRHVEDGHFREDLFYRLNVFPVRVPPLRERKDDIPLLANHFRLRFAEENGVEAPALTPDTLSRMLAYDWPGNVRELENFMERAVIMHASARSIPFDLVRKDGGGEGAGLLDRATREEWDLDRLEREYILSTLERNQWKHGVSAGLLGINRRTLYRKLKRYREEGYLPALAGP